MTGIGAAVTSPDVTGRVREHTATMCAGPEGGHLGGTVALSGRAPTRVARVGMLGAFAAEAGSREHLGITGERVAATASTLIGGP